MSLNINIFRVCSQNKQSMSSFHPLEVVGRGSETQLQGGENVYQMT